MYTLKIGGHTFQIIQKDLGEDLGETDFEEGIIYIHHKGPRSIKESTLIHEIFHVMNPTMDTSPDGHRILESLAEQFYQVLADNKMVLTDHILGRDD